MSARWPVMTEGDLIPALRLLRSEHVGPITFYKLLTRFGSPHAALEALPGLAARGGRRKPEGICSQTKAEDEIAATHGEGGQFLLYGSADYPSLLLPVPDAPPILICKGNTKLWAKHKPLAMVGARNASANGCRFAHQLANDLGQKGLLVVSGLARGVDSAAHQGSLATGTVAVIAGGIDTIYPPENERLYKLIAEQGAILSEQPIGTKPFAQSFPSRNRIIAGMSFGTVVVEASRKSGSLITAHNALDYGRDVFAVPGSPMDPRSQGGNDLLRQGAILTESWQDVVNHLPTELRPPVQMELNEEVPENWTPDEAETPENLRQSVIYKLSLEPVLVDELLVQCQITPGALAAILLELELAGRLVRYAGNRVSLRSEVDAA